TLRPPEARRRWAFEDDSPPARVDKAEPRGVQADTSEGVAPAPVRPVADDRMPERSELGADLAPPSRHERELEQCRPSVALQHAVTGDRLLAAPGVARGPDAQGPILHEVPGQHALPLGLGRDRQEPRGLVDNQEVFVLVDEPERRRKGGRGWRVELNTVVRAYRGVATADNDAVDAHARACKPLLEPTARRPRVQGAQPLPELTPTQTTLPRARGRRATGRRALRRELAVSTHEVVAAREPTHGGLLPQSGMRSSAIV